MKDGREYGAQAAGSPAVMGGAGPLVITAIIISALYVGRDVFVPVALAILLSFILAPLVRLVRRWIGRRVFSVIVVVMVATLIAGAIITTITTQISQLGANFPGYEATIKNKFDALKLLRINGFTIETAANAVTNLANQLSPDPQKPPASAVGNATPVVAPIPVEVHQLPMSPVETLKVVLGPILTSLASIGLVLIFAILILLQREDLRDRLIRLAGVHDLTRATAAINDTAARLSRLFVMQTMINTCFGAFIGAGLALIGVPNPILWGVFAAFMRFVPFIGALISAALPIGLAAAVDPGWTMLIETMALFLVSDLILGQAIEPRLHGQSTGLSPIAIIVATTFWTWLWGPVGLVLATPLTVCLATLGRHIDQLAFLEVLFGDQPALSPSQGFYQRILAGDPAEAADQAEIFLKEHSRLDYCDTVLLKGLDIAARDIQRGALKRDRLPAFRDAALELLEMLEELDDNQGSILDAANGEQRETFGINSDIVCFSGRNPLDEVAAATLAQLLRRSGYLASIRSFQELMAVDVAPAHPQIICLSSLSLDSSPSNLRFLIRKLRKALPSATFIACFWNLDDVGGAGSKGRQAAGADLYATSLQGVVALCQSDKIKNEAVA